MLDVVDLTDSKVYAVYRDFRIDQIDIISHHIILCCITSYHII